MITANTPSTEEVLKRINEATKDYPKNQDTDKFFAIFANSIGGREFGTNAVNLKWFFAQHDSGLNPMLCKILDISVYEEIINAIYAESPAYAAETIMLFEKITNR